MGKRSAKPKWIKKGKKSSTFNPRKPSASQPMNFKKGQARKPRIDTGKKITKFPSSSPNRKIQCQ